MTTPHKQFYKITGPVLLALMVIMSGLSPIFIIKQAAHPGENSLNITIDHQPMDFVFRDMTIGRDALRMKPNGDLIIYSDNGDVRIDGTTGHVYWSGKTPDAQSRAFWDAVTLVKKYAKDYTAKTNMELNK